MAVVIADSPYGKIVKYTVKENKTHPSRVSFRLLAFYYANQYNQIDLEVTI